jgi:hypothetical protein
MTELVGPPNIPYPRTAEASEYVGLMPIRNPDVFQDYAKRRWDALSETAQRALIDFVIDIIRVSDDVEVDKDDSDWLINYWLLNSVAPEIPEMSQHDGQFPKGEAGALPPLPRQSVEGPPLENDWFAD